MSWPTPGSIGQQVPGVLTRFFVSIANSNPSVLTAPLPIIPTVPNYVCSKLITATQLNVPAATGYTIQLTNIFNNTDVRIFFLHHRLRGADCWFFNLATSVF